MAGGKKAVGSTPRAIFDSIDADHSGTIDADELGMALRKMGRCV